MQARSRIFLARVVICVIAGLAWELLGTYSVATRFLVGTPSLMFAELRELFSSGLMIDGLTITGAEAAAGLVAGTVLGSTFGLSLWYSDTVATVTRPFILAAGSLPVFVLAPLMIVWFGVGFEMKVALATFGTVFVAFNQAYRGARAVSGGYVDVLKGMNASRHQIFFKVIVPGSLDWVLSSMRLNVGFCLLGAFIGEFIAADKGLGYLIIKASGLYNMPRALAAAACIIVLALSFDRAAAFVEAHRHSVVQFLSVPRQLWHDR